MYDIIIVGLGPAGLTAAIYAARRQMKTLLLGKDLGGQVAWASKIENYPGFESIDSLELVEKISKQVAGLGVEVKYDEIIRIAKDQPGSFSLTTKNNQEIQTKTIVLALGMQPRHLNIPGEKELVGRGVAYCANCDGPFYKNKVVAVVGGGNAALDAAEVLSKIARQVYLFHRFNYFEGFEVLADKVKNNEKIKIYFESEIKEIVGSLKVEKIKFLDYKTKKENELELDGLFVEIGHEAKTDFLDNLIERDKVGQIITDQNCQTSLPGVFAAGDVTQTPFKQIIIAAGQGAQAALSSYKYIQEKKNA